jgi:hypothetical protein
MVMRVEQAKGGKDRYVMLSARHPMTATEDGLEGVILPPTAFVICREFKILDGSVLRSGKIVKIVRAL